MKHSGYSVSEQIGRFKYRYNYDTGNVEQLGKTVLTQEVNGRLVPVVGINVLKSIPISVEQFEKAPGYWFQLLDALTEREKENEKII